MIHTVVDRLKNTAPIYKNIPSMYIDLKEFTDAYNETKALYNSLITLKQKVINPLKYKNLPLLLCLPYELNADMVLWRMSNSSANSKKEIDILNNKELLLNNVLDFYLDLYNKAQLALEDFKTNYFSYLMEYLRVEPTMTKDSYITIVGETLYVLSVEDKKFFGFAYNIPMTGEYSFSDFGQSRAIPINYNIGFEVTKDWLLHFYPEDYL